MNLINGIDSAGAAQEMETEDSPLLTPAQRARKLVDDIETAFPGSGEVEPPSAEPEPEPCEQPQPPAARRQRGRPRKSPMDADGPAEPMFTPANIDQHLEFVKAQLTALPIPAEAVRVYREIVGVLPSSLVDALLPITRLVEDRS